MKKQLIYFISIFFITFLHNISFAKDMLCKNVILNLKVEPKGITTKENSFKKSVKEIERKLDDSFGIASYSYDIMIYDDMHCEIDLDIEIEYPKHEDLSLLSKKDLTRWENASFTTILHEKMHAYHYLTVLMGASHALIDGYNVKRSEIFKIEKSIANKFHDDIIEKRKDKWPMDSYFYDAVNENYSHPNYTWNKLTGSESKYRIRNLDFSENTDNIGEIYIDKYFNKNIKRFKRKIIIKRFGTKSTKSTNKYSGKKFLNLKKDLKHRKISKIISDKGSRKMSL